MYAIEIACMHVCYVLHFPVLRSIERANGFLENLNARVAPSMCTYIGAERKK